MSRLRIPEEKELTAYRQSLRLTLRQASLLSNIASAQGLSKIERCPLKTRVSTLKQYVDFLESYEKEVINQ